ncbi:MAG TPA: TRAP transporter fused permease subunit, partial [Thermodesulfobacteriota bacterium]|nr:TRAP transporter fused permease subunit [Thermodesulfobacteriota bacterium]
MSGQALRPVVLGLEAVLTALVVLWVLDAPGRLGIALYTEQFLAAVLGLTLALAFLLVPARRRTDGGAAWYDLAAAAAGLAACLYVAVRYPRLVVELVHRPLDGVLVSAAILVLLLEATRRTAGAALVLVVLAFCAYALLGHLLPGPFASRPVAVTRLLVYLGIDSNALLGTPLQVAAVVVVPFILMGQLLTKAGGADYFTDIASALMGRYRGGAAKIAVVGSGLFGLVSGSAVANVAVDGLVSIPLMKRSGFRGEVAAAIEAVASTGGQLVPPVMGAAAFLMAEYLQVPYRSVMLAAVIPAFLYYLALFMQVDLEATKLGISGAPVARLPSLGEALRSGWHFPIPFAVLVLGLVVFNMPAEYAALLATAVLLPFTVLAGYKGRRLAPGEALSALVSAAAVVVDIVLITAAAGLVIGVLNLTGLAFGLTLQLLALSGDNLAVLLVLAAAVAILLGMGMPTTGVYIILAALLAPALVKSGITPMQAHLFVLYFGMMSMVTPPVALAAFTAANIAQTDPWRTGWTAMRIGWCAYLVPFLFVGSRHLLMDGSALGVLGSLATAALGVVVGSIGVAGYFRGRLPWWRRLAFLAAGVALLVPLDFFAHALALNLAGAAAAGLLLAAERRRP